MTHNVKVRVSGVAAQGAGEIHTRLQLCRRHPQPAKSGEAGPVPPGPESAILRSPVAEKLS